MELASGRVCCVVMPKSWLVWGHLCFVGIWSTLISSTLHCSIEPIMEPASGRADGMALLKSWLVWPPLCCGHLVVYLSIDISQLDRAHNGARQWKSRSGAYAEILACSATLALWAFGRLPVNRHITARSGQSWNPPMAV
jgi:hypothetical protein